MAVIEPDNTLRPVAITADRWMARTGTLYLPCSQIQGWIYQSAGVLKVSEEGCWPDSPSFSDGK